MLNREMVKAARLNMRLTQTDFAKILGVSPSTIQHVESGRRNVSDTLRARIVQEVDFGEFIPFFERYSEFDKSISL